MKSLYIHTSMKVLSKGELTSCDKNKVTSWPNPEREYKDVFHSNDAPITMLPKTKLFDGEDKTRYAQLLVHLTDQKAYFLTTIK